MSKRKIHALVLMFLFVVVSGFSMAERSDSNRNTFLLREVRKDVPAATQIYTMGRALLCDGDLSSYGMSSVYEGIDNEVLSGKCSYDIDTLDLRRKFFEDLEYNHLQIFHCSDKLHYYCLNDTTLHSVRLDTSERRNWNLMDFDCDFDTRDFFMSKLL